MQKSVPNGLQQNGRNARLDRQETRVHAAPNLARFQVKDFVQICRVGEARLHVTRDGRVLATELVVRNLENVDAPIVP